MPRTMRLAVRIVPLVLLTACGGHPHLEPGPAGLAYLCGGEPLTIVYNDGGYLPGSTVRDAGSNIARSGARLTFHGRAVDLVADEAFTDLRYVAVDGTAVWTAQAETARLEQDGAPPVDCQRVRTITPAAPIGAEPPHPAA